MNAVEMPCKVIEKRIVKKKKEERRTKKRNVVAETKDATNREERE